MVISGSEHRSTFFSHTLPPLSRSYFSKVRPWVCLSRISQGWRHAGPRTLRCPDDGPQKRASRPLTPPKISRPVSIYRDVPAKFAGCVWQGTEAAHRFTPDLTRVASARELSALQAGRGEWFTPFTRNLVGKSREIRGVNPGSGVSSPPEAEATAHGKSCAAVKRQARPNEADSANTCPCGRHTDWQTCRARSSPRTDVRGSSQGHKYAKSPCRSCSATQKGLCLNFKGIGPASGRVQKISLASCSLAQLPCKLRHAVW